MNLEIIIPSKGRISKLTNCINSILLSSKHISIQIKIYFSVMEELQHFYKSFKDIDEIKLRLMGDYRVPDFWNMRLQNCEVDALCYANDDILFLEDTVGIICKNFPRYFPDFDGIMGLNQINIPHSQAVKGAFGVIGVKYADRFPDRQVFCPQYDRFFADHELWVYAKKLNKFIFCEEAMIEHLHPNFYPKLSDKTHTDVRQYWKKDNLTFQKRQKQGLLWGETYELINEKE